MDFTQISKEELERAGCLRRLFRYRYILRSKNTQWFQKIIEYRNKLQQTLNHFFLTLVIDESLGVIYLQEGSEDVEESIGFKLGRNKRLGSFTTLLLFQLRHERLQFYLNPDEAVVPLIKKERMREYLKGFDRNEIDARFEKAFLKAVKELKDLQVLHETAENAEVFEITAICDLMLPVDEIKTLQRKMLSYFGLDSEGMRSESSEAEKQKLGTLQGTQA
jgi:hypothetical protein